MKKIPQKKISEGSYGCIFRPGYRCDGRSLDSNKFITKIQKEQSASIRESEISSQIRKIDHYDDFFSPILEPPCLVDLATIEDDEIKKCGFINSTKNKETKYETNKIKYIGKRTLADELYLLFKKQPKNIFKYLFESHIHLLDGYKKLIDAGIIHFDVKENNIVCETKTHTPIIIDFGLSFQIANIEKDNYKHVFFTYGPDYGPWCIEIALMTYVANELGDGWQENPIEQKDITKVLYDFFSQNDAIKKLFTDDEQKEYHQKLTDLFTNEFVVKKLTWKQATDYLIKSKTTWDNYALSIVFLYIIKDMNLNSYQSIFPKFGEYIKLLKTIVLSLPEQRPNIEETKKSILDLLANIRRKENLEIQKTIIKTSNNMETAKELYKNIMNTKINQLKKEEKIYAENN